MFKMLKKNVCTMIIILCKMISTDHQHLLPDALYQLLFGSNAPPVPRSRSRFHGSRILD